MKKKYIFTSIILGFFILCLSSCSKDNPVSVDQTILPPTLLTPANGDTGIGITPTLTWSTVANVNGYWLQVSRDSAFSENIEFNYEGVSTNSKTLQELELAQKYYWRVKSFAGKTYSEWSKVWSFSTSTKPNYPPFLMSNPQPANGETNTSMALTLSWVGGDPDSGDIVKYKVLLSTVNPPLYWQVHDTNLTSCSTIVNDIIGRQTYYWQVIAEDNHSNITTGPVWSFTTLNPWTILQDMPTARSYMSADTCEGKIYVIGGRDLSNQPLSAVEVYDPANNNWAVKTSIPTARYGQSMASLNGKLYVFGGYKDSALHVVESYDPVNDVWIQKQSMPYASFMQAATVYNGKIYLFGDYSNALPTMRYDPMLDTFEVLSSKAYMYGIRTAVTHYASRKIYIMGWDCFEYYPENDILYHRLFGFLYDGSAVIQNDNIYMLQCISGVNEFLEWNVITRKSVGKTPPNISRTDVSAVEINNKIYIIGGGSNVLETYDLKLDSGGE